jgi:hypothetical protein
VFFTAEQQKMKQETAAERQWKQNEHRDQDLARVKRSKEKD